MHVEQPISQLMKKIFAACLVLVCLLLVGGGLMPSCTETSDRPNEFSIKRVWKLSKVVYYDEEENDYSDGRSTWLRIYDDSCYYVCQLLQAPNGLMFVPSAMDHYTLIDKGQRNFLYLHDDDKHPLTVLADTSMVIQENGVLYHWQATDELDADKVQTIIDIVRKDVSEDTYTNNKYVLSYAERRLEETNHSLIYSLIVGIFLLFVVLSFAYILHRDKRRMEQEKKRVEQALHQLEQERQTMPEPVREAMHSLEDEFHNSDFYTALHRRLAAGDRLSDDDWTAIEDRLRSVYPRFSSTLFSLISMSEMEYRVCLLLKLNASPTEIASVLCRDKSSISTVRSRLYQKVFDKKGSSRDWDEFVRTL